MSEIKKLEIETEETPQAQPSLPETQIAMATAFGQMTETNRQLMERINQREAQESQTTMLLNEALAEMRALKLQTDTTSRHVEQLNESQTAIMSEVITNFEKDENPNLMEVTPMETHIEIDQKPAKKTNGIWAMLFR